MSVIINTLISSLAIGLIFFLILEVFWIKSQNRPLNFQLVKDGIFTTIILMFFISMVILTLYGGREDYDNSQKIETRIQDIAKSLPGDVTQFENVPVRINGPVYIYDMVDSKRISPSSMIGEQITDEECFFFLIVNKSRYYYSTYKESKFMGAPVDVYGEDIRVVIVGWPSKKILGAKSIHGSVPDQISIPDRPVSEWTFPATYELNKWISSITTQ
jgi:hypothetical protein